MSRRPPRQSLCPRASHVSLVSDSSGISRIKFLIEQQLADVLGYVMPKGLSRTTKDNVDKCRSAAIAEAYNRPGSRFRTALYVVLIVIAWQAFFHAYFYKRGRKPWYQSRTSKSKRGVRYQKADGEPKHWDLSKCLAEYFKNKHPPVRKNIEFLLGLRNKIEHRHLPALDPILYGECQAALMKHSTQHLTRAGGGLRAGRLAILLRLPERQKTRHRPRAIPECEHGCDWVAVGS